MYFEDFEVRQTFGEASRTLDEAEVVAFAKVYDPQQKHADAAWAASGPFGGLIASGFQTLGVAWSLFLRLGISDAFYVGIGIDELRWLKPVRPGDTLTVRAEVVEKGAPRKGKGRVAFAHTVENQQGQVVLTYRTLHLIYTKEA